MLNRRDTSFSLAPSPIQPTERTAISGVIHPPRYRSSPRLTHTFETDWSHVGESASGQRLLATLLQYPFVPVRAKTVILRLIDPNGRPEVKIVASEQGAGLSFVGDSDATQVLLEADGTDSSLKLTNKDGRQQLGRVNTNH
jgi:hypothetical protein